VQHDGDSDLANEDEPAGRRGSTELPAPDPEELAPASETVSRDYGPGDVIDDRFEVVNVLGSGGFSKVYRVQDVVEGEERALKLFNNASGYDAVRRDPSGRPPPR
jgi:serine/threonine protein kinase